jgi:uncharacterized coiled-coil DUF342 family protein
VPYQREAAIVLEMWREVERRLARVGGESEEAEELHAEAARLRNEYQRLIEEATKYHRPVPPPMPPE